MFLGWFWPIFLFSLRDINLTLGLLPPRKHVVWRDSVGVGSSGSGLKIIVRGYFASEFSLLLRHTDEPQKGRNSCLWLQTRYVLSSFGVLLMSWRVNFHVVRSALQYSACRIICLLSLCIYQFFYILQINVGYSWVQIKLLLLLLQAFIIDITHMDDSLYLIFPPIFEKVVKWGSGSFEFYLLVCVILHECHSIRGHSRDVIQ